MIAFFKRYSYECVRMMLNQFAISMFGFALAMTAVKAKSDALLLWSSIAAIVFYLILTYSTAWRVGSGDRTGIRYEKISFNPLTGFIISLAANAANFLLGLLIMIGSLFSVGPLLGGAKLVALLAEGMYQGVLTAVTLGETPLHDLWWSYLLIPIPALVASLLGYVAGAKEFRIIKSATPEYPASDRPSRKELKEQKELNKNSRK